MTLTGLSAQYDLREGFPLLQERKIFFFRNVLPELAWMLSGKTKISDLKAIQPNCSIWDPWGDKGDDLGPIYGQQWRGADGYIDQIALAIETIKAEPTSRRILVNSWQVADIEVMRLPPCHFAFQFHPFSSGFMDLTLYQRSADYFVGVPYNLAFYALLLKGFCKLTGYKPRFLNHQIGDAHLYANHERAAAEVIDRNYRMTKANEHTTVSCYFGEPFNNLEGFIDILTKGFGYVSISGYVPRPHIDVPIAV